MSSAELKHWSIPILIEKPTYAKRKGTYSSANGARFTALGRSMEERIGVKRSVEVSESRPSVKRPANFVDKIDNSTATTGTVAHGRPAKKLCTGRSVARPRKVIANKLSKK